MPLTFLFILQVKTNYFTFFQTNKPLTEKRRRERINNSMMQLKTLVLRGTNKEVGDLPDALVELKIRNSLLPDALVDFKIRNSLLDVTYFS